MNRPLANTLLALLLLTSCVAAWACPPLRVGLERVSDTLWIRPAQADDRAGWTEPVVIWVGINNLLIADPGPHRCAGIALKAELSRRWPQHRHALLNSHSHPRNVLANSAWPRGTPIHALASVAHQMKQRCPRCLAALRSELGQSWMQGTRIVVPNRLLKPGETLPLAQTNWLVMEHTGTHTEADLMLVDAQTNSVYAPSLLSWGKLPDLARAQPLEWLRVLNEPGLSRRDTVWLGHATAAQGLADADFTRAYLLALWLTLSTAWEAGRSEHEFHADRSLLAPGMQDPASLRQHSLNVQRVWRLLEERDLQTPR